MEYVVVIPNINPRLPSWNTFYGGVNYHLRTKIKKTWAEIVRAALFENGYEMFDESVDVTIVAYYKGRVPDSDNLCAKVIIDPLIGLVIKDDDRRYVRRVTLESRHDKENPRIVLRISPTKECD
jgi:hypothetical protein